MGVVPVERLGPRGGVLDAIPECERQVSSFAGRGTEPIWSKDGKRLYYLDANQKLTVVEIKIENNAVQTGARKTLFQTSLPANYDEAGYDVARDGRFLIMSYATETHAPMTLVMNWDAELKK